ncbi:MAG: YbaB/EbfC family nucleoid-associated protein [Anaerolineaceae bacterium]|nr:YbaB/EbfC family nucleoid-associated protein [Anaerolineaceae bacterium]
MQRPGGGNMMAQIQKMQEQMAQAQASLADEKVTSTAGGGAVSITMSGDQRVLEVKIEKDILESGDVEMLQDMVLTATNKAIESSKKLAEDKMAPFTGMLSGLGLGF